MEDMDDPVEAEDIEDSSSSPYLKSSTSAFDESMYLGGRKLFVASLVLFALTSPSG